MLDAFKKVAKSNLYIEDRNCPTISEVFEECEKLKEKGELDLVLIDYIQLIKSDQTIVPQLKELAVKFSVPVVVTSQIHQVVEQKENKRPQLRHFIGPSEEELNEYADHVITIFRPDYYKKTFRKSRQVVEVNILKNRYAKPISLSLTWDGNVGKFLG